jgi:hypothetical protein
MDTVTCRNFKKIKKWEVFTTICVIDVGIVYAAFFYVVPALKVNLKLKLVYGNSNS